MKRSEDKSYRRGAVVGLTTAELFMLTSFMLITALLLAEAHLPRKASADAERPTPGVSDAVARAALEIEVDRLTSQSENLAKRLTDSEAERDAAQSRYQQVTRMLADEENRRRQAEKDVDWALAAAVEAREAAKAAEAATKKSGRQQAQQEKDAAKAIQGLKAKVAEAQGRAATAKQALDAAQRQLAALRTPKKKPAPRTGSSRQKGVDPPCWYTPERRPDGSIREKPLYLMDVAIHDRHIVLGRRVPPSGGPDDEKGSYTAEFAQIGAHRLPYGEPLEDAEVRQALRGIRDQGDNAKIRSYPCKSYAKVWDFTGTTSKRRWREALENVVELHLLTYKVRDDPWPH